MCCPPPCRARENSALAFALDTRTGVQALLLRELPARPSWLHLLLSGDGSLSRCGSLLGRGDCRIRRS